MSIDSVNAKLLESTNFFDNCFINFKKEDSMHQIHSDLSKSLLTLSVCLFLALAVTTASESKENQVTQTAGVDNTKMGAYRALAQLSYQAFSRGEKETAAKLSRILERSWDAAEEHGGAYSLRETNRSLFIEIDKAMDEFINLIMHSGTKAPDRAAVEEVYNEYLNKLKQGDL